MIEIKSAEADAAAALCACIGVTADTVLEMTERGERLGFVCMVYGESEVVLLHLEAPDIALTDALLRAALNSARTAGAQTAHIVCEPLRLYMQRKGYISDFASSRVRIDDFFAKTACNA